MRRLTTACAVLAALALVAAACGSSSSSGAGTAAPKVYSSIGQGEGALKLIAWNGYTENGSNDPNYDWVTPFQDQTGCKVTVKYADTSDEMVTLMRQGGGSVWDGVSASGNASNKLIAGGNVAAVSTSLFPEFPNVISP
ncbi:MAG TPA: spermidine/putrescine ABC transporter substrate-binding protein, partial [Actinomycetota bacterium]|nr:spermidine/putrescine ABC transporter substrate-binding protein [Actinomycetota bacterium]